MRRAAPAVAATVVVASLAASCSSEGASPDTLEPGVVTDPSAPSITVVAGSTVELLAEMTTSMSQLGSLIAEGGDDDATLALITATWGAARPDVQTTRPELVASIDTTVDMATVAVDRTRPADADKAFKLLSDLVDDYTGDG